MYPGKWAAMNPDKPALIMADTEEMITYAQLEERSLRLANYMRSIGFEKGDHLAVMAEPDRDRRGAVGGATHRRRHHYGEHPPHHSRSRLHHQRL